jgi:hypothetical protein
LLTKTQEERDNARADIRHFSNLYDDMLAQAVHARIAALIPVIAPPTSSLNSTPTVKEC